MKRSFYKIVLTEFFYLLTWLFIGRGLGTLFAIWKLLVYWLHNKFIKVFLFFVYYKRLNRQWLWHVLNNYSYSDIWSEWPLVSMLFYDRYFGSSKYYIREWLSFLYKITVFTLPLRFMNFELLFTHNGYTSLDISKWLPVFSFEVFLSVYILQVSILQNHIFIELTQTFRLR